MRTLVPRSLLVGLLVCVGCSPSTQGTTSPAPIVPTTPVAVPASPPEAPPSPPTEPAKAATPADPPTLADIASAPVDSLKTESGLASQVLRTGTGTTHPSENDQVRVHYTGWSKDGRMFDSSVERGEPSRFGVTKVIAGFSEALMSMVVGEKRRVWIPSDLAYGDAPQLAAAPAGQLTFDIELLAIEAMPTPPEVPVDVAAAPKTAKRTASGLAYVRLTAGTGKRHPTARSRVTVHYSGWTKDGKMFDSSVVRAMPTTFPLNGVIPGWTEGVQLMVEGEKARFWIPGKLAYGESESARPGAPVGQLTFDIELISIE